MKQTKINISIIQKNQTSLDNPLNRIQKDDNNILFSYCTSFLRIGKVKINIQFDTALYCEKSDLLVVLVHGGIITPDQFRQELDKRGIPFNEVIFDVKEYKEWEEESKEIWFARNSISLEEAINDSKRKGYDVGTFYPTIKGKFELKYNSDEEGTVPFESQDIRGVIELEDKFILLINHVEDCNVYYKKALKLLSKNGITVIIDRHDNFEPKNKPKQYKKER